MNRKRKLVTAVALLGVGILLAGLVTAEPRTDLRGRTQSVLELDNDGFLGVNRLGLVMGNTGNFAYDVGSIYGKSDGLYFPFTSLQDILDRKNTSTVIFASGLWVGAIDSTAGSPDIGDTLITVAEYSSEWYPGPWGSHLETPDGVSNPDYRLWHISRDSIEYYSTGGRSLNDYYDYANWPVAQGAPVDSLGNPELLGDEMWWCVFNDGDPSRHSNDAGNTAPLGLEVRATYFAFDRQDALGNVIFMRFQIFNKGGKDLRQMYISLWADPDLGGAGDDLVGSDTTLSLGYCYNATNNDNTYGSLPPAVGYDFFQGPLIFTGDNADTAKMWGQKWPQYVNLGMASFNKYINGTDPQNYRWTYQYMNGLDASQGGAPVIDPTTGDTTTFFGNGDPVTGTGFIDANPADRRYMLSTGPINFAPGDSTEIIAAMVVGQCGDRLSSITHLKFLDAAAQDAFDKDFQVEQPPVAPEVVAHALENVITLEWSNAPEIQHGSFPFQGYAVLQGESPSGPWKVLATYDVKDNVRTVVEEAFDLNVCLPLQSPTKLGTDAGLRYYHIITNDALRGGKIVNNRDYYFRVEAYSWDTVQVFNPKKGAFETQEKTLTAATVVTVTPQGPTADVDLPTTAFDTLEVTHTAGFSGGLIYPLVVGPDSLTGHTYQVVFEDTVFIPPESLFWNGQVFPGPDTLVPSDGELFWHLLDVTDGDTVLFMEENLTGDETYKVADGLLVKVIAPTAGFKSFQVVANGAGPLDPPEPGAFAFQGFPTVDLDGDGEFDNPTDNQQVGEGHWALHTADNGGSSGGGTRGSFDAFIARVTRDGGNDAAISIYDYEMRFTGDPANPGVGGSYAWDPFTDDAIFWVPFELWRIGIDTPDDTTDDVRLVPLILDAKDGFSGPGDDAFTLESWGSAADSCSGLCEHSASSADNDPYTDWVYWYMPTDSTPGQSGYLYNENDMLGGSYAGDSLAYEIFARTVLINWNGGVTPPFNQDLPEQGTVFRILTQKPITVADTFTFTAPAPVFAAAGGEDRLEKIRAVPNPYYLESEYDLSTLDRRMRFTNLPVECTIRIFNLAGDQVAVIERNDPSRSWEEWNLLTSAGIPVGPGIYIYVVESRFGTKVGKMAIFHETEQLQNF